jgi:hypothetical protein
MDRRGFLRTTFVAGLATGTGCAADMAERAAKAPLDDAALERRLQRLERTLARMDSRFAREWFLEQRRGDLEDPEASDRLLADGELLRTSLRLATAVSALAELPEGNHRDPRVAAQVGKLVGEADYAVFGTMARLDALDDATLAELDREAAEDPGMIERMSDQVEALARDLGVETSQRLHLRSMTKQVGWRLQRESFSAVVRDTIGKTDAMLAGAHRRIVEAGGQTIESEWTERTRAAVEYEYNPTLAQLRAEYEQTRRNRNILLGTGAAMIAVGGGLALAGGLLLPTSAGGAILTVGGIGLTAGVIVLILGIWLAVRSKRQRRQIEAMESGAVAP